MNIIELIYNKRAQSSNSLPKQIKYNGRTYNEGDEICKVLNAYFGDIGIAIGFDLQNVTEMFDHNNDISIKLVFFEFNETDAHEILQIICNLNSNSASGYDEINANLVKKIAEEIAPILVTLINSHLHRGIFPDELKIGRITLIHKGGKK